MNFTDIGKKNPARPETSRFQRNVKRSLLNSFIEGDNAIPIAESNTIEYMYSYNNNNSYRV